MTATRSIIGKQPKQYIARGIFDIPRFFYVFSGVNVALRIKQFFAIHQRKILAASIKSSSQNSNSSAKYLEFSLKCAKVFCLGS